VAVTTTMIITTALAFVVARRLWGWGLPLTALVTALFLLGDFAFFGANIVKLAHGGWFPLVVAAVVFLMFSTWKRGRELLHARLAEHALPADLVVTDIGRRGLPRARGTAIFLTSDTEGAPIALLHNIKHNEVVHEQNIFLTVVTEDVPLVHDEDRLVVTPLGEGIYRILVRYGFKEDPDVPEVLERAAEHGVRIDPMKATYFLSRDNIVPSRTPAMMRWRERLFVFMKRNSRDAASYFRLPPNRVVELGMQVEIS
jgi:KUP system potassium uptake protein